MLAQIDKCNGYILGAHDTNVADAGGPGGKVSNLFRTAFSDTHEPMFEKVGSVQERYMPGTYGTVPPELLMNGTGEGRAGSSHTAGSPGGGATAAAEQRRIEQGGASGRR